MDPPACRFRVISSSGLVSRTRSRRTTKEGRVSFERIREIGVGHAPVRVHRQGALERLQSSPTWPGPAAQAAARRDRRRTRPPSRAATSTASSAERRRRKTSSPIPASGCFDDLGPERAPRQPTILAAEAKARRLQEAARPGRRRSYGIWQRVAATGVKHLCAFNYRFVRRFASRKLIDAGELGRYATSGALPADWGTRDAEVWRFDRSEAARRARRPRGARRRSRALPRRRDRRSQQLPEDLRPDREVDDAVEATVAFANGAVETLEATPPPSATAMPSSGRPMDRRARSRSTSSASNELQVFRATAIAAGLQDRPRLEADHPSRHWCAPGHVVGSVTRSSTSSTTSWRRSR